MANYVENQPLLLNIQSGQSTLSGATVPKIHYKKPDGTEAVWAASDGVVVSGTDIQYDIPGNILVTGRWYFHAGVILAADTVETKGKRVDIFMNASFDKTVES